MATTATVATQDRQLAPGSNRRIRPHETAECLHEPERAELVRLRGELKDVRAANAELQMQVEFAKKVASWFAKGKQ